jgi:hypothetical protein
MLHVGFFGLAGAISASCFTVEYPVTAFRCNPSQTDACPEGFQCCSDDASAMKGTDVGLGVLPSYLQRYSGNDTGIPIFSGSNNVLSTSGLCVESGALPPGGGLIDPGAEGCPVPCNPKWGSSEVEKICGVQSLCCQTVEITVNDCVLDSGNSCWRPAKGDDIFDSTVVGLKFPAGPDPWAGSTHDTHQDAGGNQCAKFSQGQMGAQNACFSALTVADQRGFCLGKSPAVQFCPLAQGGYLDACDQLNLQEGRNCG